MNEHSRPGEVTLLLKRWRQGDHEALDRIMPLVETELRRLARSYMRRERRNHTLQPTALVNEAYLRLVDQRRVKWGSRAHFIGIAATLMRRILVDSARRRASQKRGGHLAIEDVGDGRRLAAAGAGSSTTTVESLLALDNALRRLGDISPRQSRVVELRHFGGLANREIAEVLKLSTATVKRDWTIARAWLYRELSGGETAV